jgi:hypothetical protein
MNWNLPSMPAHIRKEMEKLSAQATKTQNSGGAESLLADCRCQIIPITTYMRANLSYESLLYVVY